MSQSPTEFPSLFDQAKNLANLAKDVITSDQPILASEELQKERMYHCQRCEHFSKTSKRCKQCGCFLKHKVKIQQSKCPIDKW